MPGRAGGPTKPATGGPWSEAERGGQELGQRHRFAVPPRLSPERSESGAVGRLPRASARGEAPSVSPTVRSSGQRTSCAGPPLRTDAAGSASPRAEVGERPGVRDARLTPEAHGQRRNRALLPEGEDGHRQTCRPGGHIVSAAPARRDAATGPLGLSSARTSSEAKVDQQRWRTRSHEGDRPCRLPSDVAGRGLEPRSTKAPGRTPRLTVDRAVFMRASSWSRVP